LALLSYRRPVRLRVRPYTELPEFRAAPEAAEVDMAVGRVDAA
jgi:hypothetical protein